MSETTKYRVRLEDELREILEANFECVSHAGNLAVCGDLSDVMCTLMKAGADVADEGGHERAYRLANLLEDCSISVEGGWIVFDGIPSESGGGS